MEISVVSKHRRARSPRDLARRRRIRPAYDRILVVCEGEKTEPNYLGEIKRKFRIPSADIQIIPSDYGTDPLRIVNYAHDKFHETRGWDIVFCVFDRDDHTTYHQAIKRAEALDNKLRNDGRGKVRFLPIPSVPCFELWILIHFIQIQNQFDRWEIIRQLKTKIKNYDKGMVGVFNETEPMLDLAMTRAAELRSKHGPLDGKDPYTAVDLVVQEFQKIRSLMNPA